MVCASLTRLVLVNELTFMCMKNMEKRESLFSFEFVVESVSNLLVDCTAPAVGFRLLDYPTIMIYHTDQEVLENLRFMVRNENCKPSTTKSVVETEEVHPNFREHDGTFLFQKGKSTLFSMKQQKLFNLLSSIPLYIVLVDMYIEKSPRIIGSCTVPLQSIIDEVKEEGGNVAKFSKRTINLSLFNLMGARVGQLTGSITLYCYGNALNKHFQTSKGFKGNGVDVFLENQDFKIDNVNSGAALERFENRATSRILKKIEKLNKSTEIDHSLHFENHLLNGDTPDTPSDRGYMVQKESVKPKSNTQSKIISNADNYDAHIGTYCPPPLFYCSENTDSCPITRDSKQSVCNSYKDDDGDDDDNDRMNTASSNLHDTGYVLHNDKSLSKIFSGNKAQDLDAQPESETKTEERNYSRETKSNYSFPHSEITKSTIDVDAVLSSLNDMPLLQGLFKEIIGFTRRGYALKPKVAKESAEASRKFDQNPEHRKNEEDFKKTKDYSRILADDKIGGVEINNKVLMEKTSTNTVQVAKKLVFKTTKSHRLRCAVNLAKKGTRNQHQVTTEIANREMALDCFTSEPAIKEFDPPRKEHSVDVNIVPKQFRSTTSHSCNVGVSDIASNHIEHSSPVSLEVYVPSAAGSRNSPDSSTDHSNGGGIFPDDDLVDHSGMQWSKPLERKWSGLDDLSHLKESTDLLSSRNDKIGFREPSSQGRIQSTKYSENISSASDFVSQLEGQYAPHTDNPLLHNKNYRSATNGSSSDRSRQSKASSKPLFEEESKEQESVGSQSEDLSQRTSLRSFNSSHSSLQSQSIRSTSKQKISDTSKPVLSAHSPTASRSLRTKPRNTYQSNDEITHSVDISSYESQRTDSRKEDSLPRDDIRDNLGKFIENENKLSDQYSDDFVNTNSVQSQVSSVLEEHRSPTPRHIILSQAKLGYTM